jgi:hypothetical protein
MISKSNLECGLKLPTDKEVIESPTSFLWVDEDGFLNSLSKGGTRTMKELKETIRIIKKIAGNKKICFIADTTNTRYYTIEMREELSHAVRSLFKAIALIPCTATGKLMGSILFMRKYPCPVKFFNSLDKAKEWLRQIDKESGE